MPAWHALVQAVEEADQPAERYTADDLRDLLLDGPGRDPAAQSLLGVDGEGVPRAFGHVDPDAVPVGVVRVRLLGGVHPAWRRRGAGAAVLAWQQRAALAAVGAAGHALPVHLHLFTEDGQEDVAALGARAGFAPRRYFLELARPLAGEGAQPLPPVGEPGAGLRLAPYAPALDEAVRAAHNEAFADHWGSQPRTAENWARTVTGHRDFRPGWSFVVLDETSATAAPASEPVVAAYTLSAAYPQDWAARGRSEGYTTHLGVRRAHRRRGLGRLLLARAMAAFAEDGMQGAALDVDAENPTGALGLYRGLGYETRSTGILLARELPAGEPATATA